jgi:hypothetical protein
MSSVQLIGYPDSRASLALRRPPGLSLHSHALPSDAGPLVGGWPQPGQRPCARVGIGDREWAGRTFVMQLAEQENRIDAAREGRTASSVILQLILDTAELLQRCLQAFDNLSRHDRRGRAGCWSPPGYHSLQRADKSADIRQIYSFYFIQTSDNLKKLYIPYNHVLDDTYSSDISNKRSNHSLARTHLLYRA